MASKKYKAKEVADALTQARGFVSRAAEILGCNPQTVYNYINEYETVKAAHVAVREQRHDYVESKLMQIIGEGNPAGIFFYLKCQAKDRGWVEKHIHEIGGLEEGAIPIQFVDYRVPLNDTSDTED